MLIPAPERDEAALSVAMQRLVSVAETMGWTLMRSARSPNIKERRDLSCAVFDAEGRLVAQAADIPVHLGAMPAAVAAALDRTPRWRPGDIVVLNDPFLGGSHLPDITTVSPVFAKPTQAAGAESAAGKASAGQEEGAPPIGFLATRAHHADVGGSAPGSLPIARDLFGEGLVLPPLPLQRAGTPVAEVVALICANSRTPEDRRVDLAAQRAAHLAGERALHEALERCGSLAEISRALRRRSEALCRLRLAELPAGEHRFEDELDDDGTGPGPLPLRVRLRLGGGEALVDFTGTAEQAAGGVNAPLAVARAAVYYAFACVLGDIPVNAGLFAPIQVRAPKGCLLNPRPPAPVAAGNVETSQRVVDAVLGALAKAAPDRIPAAAAGTMNNVLAGPAPSANAEREGGPWAYYETSGGGGGGGPLGPGTSGLQVHMTNTRNTPVEALELAYPMRVERYALRRGSGGSGRASGGDGLVRALRFLAPTVLTLVTERRARGPWGLAGGQPGAPGRNRLRLPDGEERELPAKGTLSVPAGALLIVETPGGGGWGRPGAG